MIGRFEVCCVKMLNNVNFQNFKHTWDLWREWKLSLGMFNSELPTSFFTRTCNWICHLWLIWASLHDRLCVGVIISLNKEHYVQTFTVNVCVDYRFLLIRSHWTYLHTPSWSCKNWILFVNVQCCQISPKWSNNNTNSAACAMGPQTSHQIRSDQEIW